MTPPGYGVVMKKLIPLLLLFVALPSWAQRQFDIEVIIFKRAVDAEKVNESWPNTQPKISLERVGSFQDTQYRAKKGVQMLPYSEYKLTPQKDKLRKHAGFEVLMHTAWRQGDQGKSSAPVFHIQAGKDFSKEFNHVFLGIIDLAYRWFFRLSVYFFLKVLF